MATQQLVVLGCFWPVDPFIPVLVSLQFWDSVTPRCTPQKKNTFASGCVQRKQNYIKCDSYTISYVLICSAKNTLKEGTLFVSF